MVESSRRRGRNHSFSSSSSHSFSSSSSSSRNSYFPENSPLSPAITPLGSFSSIPFSWETLPGIPKKQTPNKIKNHHHRNRNRNRNEDENENCPLTPLLLPIPLPPNSSKTPPTSSKRFSFFQQHWKNNNNKFQQFQKDPFFDAFMECSKEPNNTAAELWNNDNDNDNGKVVSRSLSERFGFLNLHSSCKKTACVVSESIVYLPRTSFDRTNH